MKKVEETRHDTKQIAENRGNHHGIRGHYSRGNDEQCENGPERMGMKPATGEKNAGLNRGVRHCPVHLSLEGRRHSSYARNRKGAEGRFACHAQGRGGPGEYCLAGARARARSPDPTPRRREVIQPLAEGRSMKVNPS
jgi:hypothetical protein